MANPIGICDSGSGGLTVLGACIRALPDQPFLYLGDHKRAPYGNLTESEILDYSTGMIEALFKRGVKLVVLACNTASAVALREIQENWLPKHYPDCRVLGVLVPMVEALTGLDWDRDNPGKSSVPSHNLGVFATQRTVESGAYPHQVRLRAPNVQVIQQACPGLVASIEDNRHREYLTTLVNKCCAKLMRQMIGEKLDAVFLGCTHYPLVEDIFKAALPDGVEILSQPDIVATSLKSYLERHPEYADKSGRKIDFFTTGDPASLAHLDQFLPGSSKEFKTL